MKTDTVKMPQMGQSAAEGTIVKWHKKVGDDIGVDEILVEVESDKITIEVESPLSGRVISCIDVGATVPVGDVIALIEIVSDSTHPDDTQAGKNGQHDSAKPHAESGDAQVLVSTDNMPQGIEHHDLPGTTRDWLSPTVMRLALLNNISADDLKKISGTGKNQRVTREDLLHYITQRETEPHVSTTISQVQTDGDIEVVPMTTIRRTIADHMVQSIRTSPHVTMVHAVDMTSVVELRERLKDRFFEKYGVKLTYTAVILKATARVLPEFPTINGSVSGTNIVRYSRINIGCAVALSDESLVVPVVKDANLKSFPEIAKDLDRLIKLARNKSLTRNDVESGTFTISNFGAFGSIMGTPIINQPQVAILGMGAV
ncbi:MAG: dihydrolipoamide acetyltransferase family protein, partial [Verrucomicrobia bacterium]|nr:dihydrolipoamide acetyltransferase family protein [Verrucomicrobiota bacterium]